MLHPEQNQVGQIDPPEIGYKKPPVQIKAFAAETAQVSGQTKREINRHLSRANALGDDLEAVTGTSLDKGVELDALIAAGFLEYEREQARARQGARTDLVETFPPSEEGKARDKAGERMHVSGRTVDDAEPANRVPVLPRCYPEIFASLINNLPRKAKT